MLDDMFRSMLNV